MLIFVGLLISFYFHILSISPHCPISSLGKEQEKNPIISSIDLGHAVLISSSNPRHFNSKLRVSSASHKGDMKVIKKASVVSAYRYNGTDLQDLLEQLLCCGLNGATLSLEQTLTTFDVCLAEIAAFHQWNSIMCNLVRSSQSTLALFRSVL